jgi:rare lipoprotein A
LPSYSGVAHTYALWLRGRTREKGTVNNSLLRLHRSRVATSLLAILLLAGCGEKKHARVRFPDPPPIAQPPVKSSTAAPEAQAEIPKKAEQPKISKNAKAIWSEVGYASWYGPDYHNRRGSNGEVYDMNAFTAAHRTIPLNSLVRVTNEKTGQVVNVRITDRGPFVSDRVIDLSKAAAKEVDVYKHGTQKVKVEVIESPKPIATGGRWCVQIGAIDDEDAATKLKAKLAKKYRTAKVLEFSGPRNDWWVRVRVPLDDRKKAEEIARANTAPQGSVFLVRLD